MRRELVDGAPGGEMGFGPRQPGRGRLGGLGRQGLHELDGLGEIACLERRPGARQLGLGRIALDVAHAPQRDDAADLAQHARAQGIVGDVVGQGRPGHRGKLRGQGRARGDARAVGLQRGGDLAELGVALHQRLEQGEADAERQAVIDGRAQPRRHADQRRAARGGQRLLLGGAAGGDRVAQRLGLLALAGDGLVERLHGRAQARDLGVERRDFLFRVRARRSGGLGAVRPAVLQRLDLAAQLGQGGIRACRPLGRRRRHGAQALLEIVEAGVESRLAASTAALATLGRRPHGLRSIGGSAPAPARPRRATDAHLLGQNGSEITAPASTIRPPPVR